ncbi:hypothetical protein B0H16DRAFT_1593260 [Mycena metata]|uniref:Secreted protein n=1 Tax=Mycena metata TaxID=1033252 RepID=A0AAD7MNV6_9AGAR|nr:hypothetical protein B0H16DRAFT_1593260 [Mycena metata]
MIALSSWCVCSINSAHSFLSCLTVCTNFKRDCVVFEIAFRPGILKVSARTSRVLTAIVTQIEMLLKRISDIVGCWALS